MKPAHVIGIIAVSVLGYLVNAKVNIINAELGRLMIISVLLIGVTYYFATKEGYSGYDNGSKESIEPEEAIYEVQRHLDEHPAKNKLYLRNDDPERENVHEGAKKGMINGEKHQLYAIVGRPQHPQTGEPLHGEMIRQIWDCTENQPVSYDGELPMRMGAKVRLNPWEGREDLVINSGRTAKDKEEEKNGQEIYINSSNSGKSGESSSDDEEDEEEDYYGETYKS